MNQTADYFICGIDRIVCLALYSAEQDHDLCADDSFVWFSFTVFYCDCLAVGTVREKDSASVSAGGK